MSKVYKMIASRIVQETSKEIERRFHNDPDGMRKARAYGWDRTAKLVVEQMFESEAAGREVDEAIHTGAVEGRKWQFIEKERGRLWVR